jgi:hypothetical protein
MALASALVVEMSAMTVRAQELYLPGPLRGACIARLDGYCVPASLEWMYWVTGGVVTGLPGSGAERAAAFAGVGFEVTHGVLRYHGFLAPDLGRSALSYGAGIRDDAEVRVGAWAQAVTRGPGALVEGGMTAHLGVTRDHLSNLFHWAPWGMLDLRGGAGYGTMLGTRSPHLLVALGWGYRSVSARYSVGGACDPTPEPDTFAEATGVRVTATLRRSTELPAWEAAFAVEVTPTAALIPSRLHTVRHRPAAP